MSTIFQHMVRQELETAEQAHRPIHSLHEGYAIILEELDEFWDEVKKKEREWANLILELAQVAAMCERTAQDVLGLDGYEEADHHES